jgi:hypothetical protein
LYLSTLPPAAIIQRHDLWPLAGAEAGLLVERGEGRGVILRIVALDRQPELVGQLIGGVGDEFPLRVADRKTGAVGGRDIGGDQTGQQRACLALVEAVGRWRTGENRQRH